MCETDLPKEPGSRLGAHWRNLTNMIEWFMLGGSAALYQIILTTCYNVTAQFEHNMSVHPTVSD